MTDREILELILSKVTSLEARMDAQEAATATLREAVDKNTALIKTLEVRANAIESRMNVQKTATDKLREEVNHYNIILENTVDKCVQTMGEGIQLNAERFDRLDIDAVRLKVDTAYLIAKAAIEKIDLMSA